MWDDDDAGLCGVFENVMRTTYPVKSPSSLIELAYQVGTLHVCMIHITGR